MVRKILCVAEKASIAKAVANHLAGGAVRTRDITGYKYVKNYEFDFDFGPLWGPCSVVFTSVAGHLQDQDFGSEYRKWSACNPADLFEATIETYVKKELQPVARNIETHARTAHALYIWTDCDREGEHIGSEIRNVALRAQPRLLVKRATFSNIERAHVIRAATRPTDLDERAATAVAARMELDLRIGAAFTRLLTLNLQSCTPELDKRVISYGSCQFPTLGFVVDRYWRVQRFIPEPFWKIVVKHKKNDVPVEFAWRRVRLFDRALVTILLDRCVGRLATVTNVDRKRKTKWRPLPLTTVELQKCGTMFLRMDSQKVMKVAESLYTKGFISYPRTETDQFDRAFDLVGMVEKQTASEQWGQFARRLVDGAFTAPRSGRNNDQAHPPIHPVLFVAPSALTADEKEVYTFVTRRFLACCAPDAVGEQSTVDIVFGGPNSQPPKTTDAAFEPAEGELFSASGLTVLERNYLDVYPYEKWTSSAELPPFVVGERFMPDEANMVEGSTSPPRYLTEPELIGLMDANGIGTDATMAEHIAKIRGRDYVVVRPTGGGSSTSATGRGRGGRGRGSRDSQSSTSGRGGSGTGNGVLEFIPTKLGCALIDGYESLNMDRSLSKPFLRRETELQLKQICEGSVSPGTVVRQNLDLYREIYARSIQNMSVLKGSVRRYFGGEGV